MPPLSWNLKDSPAYCRVTSSVGHIAVRSGCPLSRVSYLLRSVCLRVSGAVAPSATAAGQWPRCSLPQKTLRHGAQFIELPPKVNHDDELLSSGVLDLRAVKLQLIGCNPETNENKEVFSGLPGLEGNIQKYGLVGPLKPVFVAGKIDDS